MRLTKTMNAALTGLALLAAGTMGAAAQDDYPRKDIMNIMPWAAGGGTDTAIRTYLQFAEEPLGVDINTQNITGAQSGVGTLRLMNSRPDGYTMGTLTWDSMITVPYFGLVPGYDMDKLAYLANVTMYPTVLAVGTDTGWETLDDFIAAAKEAPGEITISNSGDGGIWHLHALDMADKLDVDLNHIPFPNGAAFQREALINGENDAGSLSYASVAGAVEAGQVKVLAVMGEERDPKLPDVPTFKELGYDVVWGGMRVLAVPAGVPEEIQDILVTKLKEAYDDPAFKAKAEEMGISPYWMDREEATAFVQRNRELATSMLDKLVEEGVISK